MGNFKEVVRESGDKIILRQYGFGNQDNRGAKLIEFTTNHEQ